MQSEMLISLQSTDNATVKKAKKALSAIGSTEQSIAQSVVTEHTGAIFGIIQSKMRDGAKIGRLNCNFKIEDDFMFIWPYLNFVDIIPILESFSFKVFLLNELWMDVLNSKKSNHLIAFFNYINRL